MKIKKEYIVLAVVIVVLVGYLSFKKTNHMHYTLPKTPIITKSEIVKLELLKGSRVITLVNKNDNWIITPGDYPVDTGKMNRIIDAITGFSINALISNGGDYSSYDLTKDKKITVKVFGTKGLLLSFAMGKHARTFRHTFVTLTGDPKVYLARGNFRRDFDKSSQELRDKHVLAFSKNDLSAITITKDGQTIALKRKITKEKGTEQGSADVGWTGADGKAIPETAMQDLFSELDGLQCDSYLDGKEKQDFMDPILVIAMQGKKSATLSIFRRKAQKSALYPATSSTSSSPFNLKRYKIQLLERAVSEIRNEKNNGKKEAGKTPMAQK